MVLLDVIQFAHNLSIEGLEFLQLAQQAIFKNVGFGAGSGHVSKFVLVILISFAVCIAHDFNDL